MFTVDGIFMILGSLFILFSAIGLFRFPDLFNKIHSATKTTTLGTILIMVGLMIRRPEWFFHLFIIMIFIIFTNPVSSHAVARSVFKK